MDKRNNYETYIQSVNVSDWIKRRWNRDRHGKTLLSSAYVSRKQTEMVPNFDT
jgi:hypothetical protein